MTDRELLELAAKAAGIRIDPIDAMHEPEDWVCWNPLFDDGDALRLAVVLGLDILRTDSDVEAVVGLPPYSPKRNAPRAFGIQKLGSDPYAATRRAIVRAAAEIGRGWNDQD